MFKDITDIFKVNCEADLKKMALGAFRYQFHNNPVYRTWASAFIKSENDVIEIEQIPFLPIELFKTQEVICEGNACQEVFISSSTTSQTPSKHYVKDLKIYENSFLKTFQLFFG